MNAPSGHPGPVRLLLVDDHTIVREGLTRILEQGGEGWSVCDASSGFQALEELRRQPFDVVIADLSMPGMSGLELIRRVRAGSPRLPILVLSMHAEEEYALRAFQSGANGYITKDSASLELVAAVHKLLRGGAHVTSSIAERVMQRLNGTVEVPEHARLSNRELEVLRRLVDGQRPTDIAEALHLSIKTISTHKSRIMKRLNITSTAGLMRYGFQHGLGQDSTPDDAALAEPLLPEAPA